MGNPGTERARKHNDTKLDRLYIMVQKGQKAELATIAASLGMSLNAFVIQAVREKLDRMKVEK